MSYNAGIVKPKITSNSSIKTRVAGSISTATRSSGASAAMSRNGSLFGIYAQRSTTGLGLHNNYLKYNSSATSALRQSLNANRTPVFNNIGFVPMPHRHDDSSNKFLNIMMGVTMGVGILKTILDGISDLKAADGSNGTEKSSVKNLQTGGSTQTASLGDLQTKESNVDKKLNNFGSEYNKINQEEKAAIQDALSQENVQAGLKEAGVDNIDFSALDLNEINITADSAEADFDTALGSIDTDIKEVTSFKTDTLGSAKKKLSEKFGELKGSIKALCGDENITNASQANGGTIGQTKKDIAELKGQLNSAPVEQRTEIQAQIRELEARQEQLEKQLNNYIKQRDEVVAAQNAIASAESNCDNLVNQLKEQKEQLKDLKEQKADIDKEQYKLAKQQTEEFEKNKKQMDGLETKIQYETNSDKKSKLIGQWNELAGEMSSLYKSLSSVNGQTFDGKNGSVKVSIDSADIKYTKRLDNESSSVGDNSSVENKKEAGGISLDDTMKITNKIMSTQIGGTVEVNGATYTKGLDGKFMMTKEAPLGNIDDPLAFRLKMTGIDQQPSLNGIKSYTAEELIAMATIKFDV